MKNVITTLIKIARYDDLIVRYENPINHPWKMRVELTFIANECQKPKNMCSSACESISDFVMILAHCVGNIYIVCMKNKKSVMI